MIKRYTNRRIPYYYFTFTPLAIQILATEKLETELVQSKLNCPIRNDATRLDRLLSRQRCELVIRVKSFSRPSGTVEGRPVFEVTEDRNKRLRNASVDPLRLSI